jgi:hypothetical protein
VKLHAVIAGDDGAMRIGQARQRDHRIDDLLGVWNGTKLRHLTLLLTRTRGSGHATGICDLWTFGRDPLVAQVELDFAPQFDDGFRMVSILDQCEFDGLGAVDEETAIESILLLGDPLASAIPADEDDV